MSILLQAADPINPFWDENLLDLIEGIRDAIGDGQIPTIARQIAAILTLIYFSVKSFARSEEHTSELQSRENLVCRLLLEKKKKQRIKLRFRVNKHTRADRCHSLHR